MSAPLVEDHEAPRASWIVATILATILMALLCGLGAVGFLVLDRGLALRSPAALGAGWNLRRETMR